MKRVPSIKKLKEYWEAGKKLVWNDPDPIKGNDYTITWIENLEGLSSEDMILIQYGQGSEAQIFIHEILVEL